MADKNGWLARAKEAAKSLFSFGGSENVTGDGGALSRAESEWGYDQVSVSTLLGSGKRQARSRTEIYQKFHFMMGDPIIASALRAHVTMALAGDAETGKSVFIDTKPDVEKDKVRAKLVEEIRSDLEPLFNRVAHQVAFNGCGFGDAYARVYSDEDVGVKDLYTDEMVYPPLVQPYSQGNRTAGYVVSTGRKFTERLSIKQIARCKMPRMLYLPQIRVVEKAMKVALAEEDMDALPLLPDLIGGSFLEAVEEAYDNYFASIAGLVGQRLLNSIDESMMGVNLEGMTLEQRKEFMRSIKAMLSESKRYAEEALKRGIPVTERRFHLIPTFGEKQLTDVKGFQGTSGSNPITIEDVLFHAKVLAGALGTDLSILGFSDLLSGGLGEGGFFRTSVQAAERAQIIRSGMVGFFWDVVDIHTAFKYGWVFDEKDRPFDVKFYSSISALEAEKQASQEKAVNGAALMLTALGQLKELGMPKEVNQQFIEKVMDQDEEMAKLLAKGLDEAIKKAAEAQAGEMGGGGFGGGEDFGAPAPGQPRLMGGEKPRQPGNDNADEEI